MKTVCTWMHLLTKRLLHKPIFMLSLLLIPLFVLFLQRSLHTGDAIIQVALYTETTNPSAMETQLMTQMISASNHTVHFYACDSLAKLQSDIRDGFAACGYVIPQHLEKHLEDHARKNTPAVTAYHQSGAVKSRLLDELVYRMIYEELAYDILEQYIDEKQSIQKGDRLRTLYQRHQQDSTFIQFEYADGTWNPILNRDNTNYMLLPIHGIVAVLILLAAMTGTIFWYEDHAHKVLIHLSGSMSILVKLLYSLIPGILAGICGFAAIVLTGFSPRISRECLSMGLFLIAVTAYCMLLRELLPSQQQYLSSIPVSVVGSILLCPVFTDLTAALPILKPLRILSPAFYYLNGIYSMRSRWALLIYSAVTFAIAIGIHQLRTHLETSNKISVHSRFCRR